MRAGPPSPKGRGDLQRESKDGGCAHDVLPVDSESHVLARTMWRVYVQTQAAFSLSEVANVTSAWPLSELPLSCTVWFGHFDGSLNQLVRVISQFGHGILAMQSALTPLLRGSV